MSGTNGREKRQRVGMAMARFSRDQALQFGWATAKRYVGSFAGILIVVGLIDAAPQVIQQQMGESGQALAALLGLALWTVPTTLVATAHVYRQLQRTPAQL